MSEERVIELLRSAEDELVALQGKNADRSKAIALTHLQTAILWMQKQQIEATLTTSK